MECPDRIERIGAADGNKMCPICLDAEVEQLKAERLINPGTGQLDLAAMLSNAAAENDRLTNTLKEIANMCCTTLAMYHKDCRNCYKDFKESQSYLCASCFARNTLGRNKPC